MRKLLILIAVLLLATVSVAAEDDMLITSQAELFGTEELERGLPASARQHMEGLDPLQTTDFMQGIQGIFKSGVLQSGSALKNAVATMIRIILIAALCQIAVAAGNERSKNAACLTAVLAIVGCCSGDIKTMIGLGRTTLDEISAFSGLLLPVMTSAAASSGSTVGAGAIYAVTTVFSNIIVRIMNALITPVLYAILAVAMVDAATQEDRLKQLRSLMCWSVETGLKGIMYAFMAIATVTGTLAGAADTAMLKAAKATISTMVPVVGGIISNASQAVLSGASLLKSTIGTFGMLGVLAIFIVPFIKIGSCFLMFKAAAALGGMLQNSLSGLLEVISKIMGYMLSLTACGAMITLISCFCLIKTVYV